MSVCNTLATPCMPSTCIIHVALQVQAACNSSKRVIPVLVARTHPPASQSETMPYQGNNTDNHTMALLALVQYTVRAVYWLVNKSLGVTLHTVDSELQLGSHAASLSPIQQAHAEAAQVTKAMTLSLRTKRDLVWLTEVSTNTSPHRLSTT